MDILLLREASPKAAAAENTAFMSFNKILIFFEEKLYFLKSFPLIIKSRNHTV